MDAEHFLFWRTADVETNTWSSQHVVIGPSERSGGNLPGTGFVTVYIKQKPIMILDLQLGLRFYFYILHFFSKESEK